MVTDSSPRSSRRARILGAVVAVLAMLAVAWFAWYLTHRPDPAAGGFPGAAAAPGQSGARGAGGPGGGGRGGPGGGRGGPPTTVGVATAEKADIPILLDALGTVVPAATATVRPQVSGVVQKINFTEGQLVKAGQVLATIDPRSFQMSQQQARGQRMRDEAQLEVARLTLQRYRTLLAEDSIARQDVDTQNALVKQLEGTVTADRAAESQASLNLGYTQVRAPISGRVGLRTVDIGNLVNTNDANGVAVITQQAPIDVQFAIPQDQVPAVAARFHAGANLPATALDRAREKVLDTGRFAALDNQVDPQTGTVKAKARFANASQSLFPSQFVNVRVELDTIRGAVVVPVSALRHGPAGDFVYVLDPAARTVALRTVTRGQGTTDKVEIKSGLQAGEQVITEGADRLKDGARVTLAGDRPQMGQGGGGGRRGNRGGMGPGGAAAGGAGSGGPRQWQGGGQGGSAGGAEGGRRRRHADGAQGAQGATGQAAPAAPAQQGGAR
ncbi:MAG: efflux RND transporter periplasmic adaptor subunit [Telluria sp.]